MFITFWGPLVSFVNFAIWEILLFAKVVCAFCDFLHVSFLSACNSLNVQCMELSRPPVDILRDFPPSCRSKQTQVPIQCWLQFRIFSFFSNPWFSGTGAVQSARIRRSGASLASSRCSAYIVSVPTRRQAAAGSIAGRGGTEELTRRRRCSLRWLIATGSPRRTGVRSGHR